MGSLNSTSNSSGSVPIWDLGGIYDEERVYVYSPDSAIWITLFSVMIALASAAIASNLLFLVTVVRDPALRKTRLSIFLVDMAVIDVLVPMGYIVLAVLKIKAHDPSFTGWIYLELFYFLFVSIGRNCFQLISCVLIVCISWERYRAVCRPFETMSSAGNLKTYAAIVSFGTILLLASFVTAEYFLIAAYPPVSVLSAVVCDSDGDMDGLLVCYNDRYQVFEAVPVINYVLVAADFLTLSISMSVFVVIIRKIKRSPLLGAASRHEKEERNLTRMAFVNNLAFVALVFLQDLSTLAVILFATSSFPNSAELVFTLQGIWHLLNSVANPVIYNIFGTRYRRAMKKTLSVCIRIPARKKKHETSGSHTATDISTGESIKTDTSVL